MPVNDPWTELSAQSSPKMNNMTVIGLTGDQLASLSPTYPGQIVFCNTTGSGYLINHWYGRNQANDEWLDLIAVDYFDFFSNLNNKKATMDKRFGTKEIWQNVVAGTGAAINDTIASNISTVDLVTGTQTTGNATIQIGGPLLAFASHAFFEVKFKTPAATTGQIVKIGVGMDKAGTGPTTGRQFGIEYCDGNANWQIHSGDGTSQSNYDTLKAVSAATTYGFSVLYQPGVSVIATFDDGTVKTKITDIPSSGSCNEADLFKISIANNNGSTTSRTLQVMGAFMVYVIADSKWV